MEEYYSVLSLVEQIKCVPLKEAFISIEVDKVKELIQLLSTNNIQAEPAYWNYPEGLYVGKGDPYTKELAVLSVKW